MMIMGKQLKRIVLLGAGAIGILPAARLLNLPEISLLCAADADRVKRYRRDGIFFNSRQLPLTFFSPEEADNIPPADLIIAATKMTGLTDALPNVRGVVAPDTIFLPVLNGICAHELIAGYFPNNRVLRGFFLGHASVREGNQIKHDGVGTFYIGGEEPALTQVQELFIRSGIDIRIPEDMDAAIWKKFILNVGINQTQAVFLADYGTVQKNPHMLDFCRSLMLEAAAVARAAGVKGSEKMVDDAIQVILSMPGEVKTSMLQDILACRRTELAAFAGTICTLAKRYRIPVPENKKILEKISRLENSRQ